MKTLKLLFACFMVLVFASVAIAETTLSPVLGSGTLKVGIDSGNTVGMLGGYTPGGALPSKPGVPYGLEADLARAIAAAIGASNIEWVDISGNGYEDRWTFLNDHTVDVVVCQSTLTSARDTSLAGKGFEWSPIYYYDGTRVLLASDIERPPVNGRYNIYVQYPVSNYDDLVKYSQTDEWNALNWDIITGEVSPEDAFVAGQYGDKVVHGVCSDGIALNSIKISNPSIDCDFYEKTLSKSPFAAATVEDDENLAEIVRWTMYVLFEAEEQEYMKGSAAPAGWVDPEVPGLAPGWSQAVINAVGNYGEIWDRAFGVGSDRGLNKLWKYGGLQYAPPF